MFRAFSTSLILEELGIDYRVVEIAGHGRARPPLWPPAAGLPFADRCSMVTEAEVMELAHNTQLICLKPVPNSFGKLIAAGVPSERILLDIDDPEWQWNIRKATPTLARKLLRAGIPRPSLSYRMVSRLWWHSRRASVTVSNPALQRVNRGLLVPHVRQVVEPLPGRSQREDRLRIGFFGTVRPHKGIDELRSAVELARVRHPGVDIRLSVTAPPPPDAAGHEQWLGTVPFAQLDELLGRIDLVAVLQRPTIAARGQLPVKVIDALARGLPVLATDYAPIRWAAGGGARYLRPLASSEEIAVGIGDMISGARRRTLGAIGRARFREQFTADAVAPALERALTA